MRSGERRPIATAARSCNAGHKLGLQYHRQKEETLYLQQGMVHRMIALTDVEMLEALTPEVEDVVRREDIYDRT